MRCGAVRCLFAMNGWLICFVYVGRDEEYKFVKAHAVHSILRIDF